MMVALVAATLCSCEKEWGRTDAEQSQVELTFRASFGAATRTAVQENGTSVWWSPGDKIQVFYGSLTSGRFTSTNPEAAAIAEFTGSLPISSATLENGLVGTSFWGVYPYNVDDACDGESVTLSISPDQIGAANTFAEGQFPAIAKSNGMDLAFYNVCGGVVFTVASEGIRSVTLTSNQGESLAGTATVSFNDDGVPEVQSVASGVSSVTLTAPFKGTFTPGTRYFITLLPGTLAGGYSMTFKTDAKQGVLNRPSSVAINRSRFRVVSEADASVSFSDIIPDPKNIVFADALIKEKLVAAFDTDGDGEISYEEAAVPDSIWEIEPGSWYESRLAGALSEAKLAKSFDEFQFFTGITEIPSGCFSGFELLTSIVLPKQLTRIGNGAFSGCSSLPSIILPNSLEYIGESAFFCCSSLKSIVIPDSVTEIGKESFAGCMYLSSAHISDNITILPQSVFNDCRNLSILHLPSQLKCIDPAAFYGCKSLISVVIPQGVETIEGNAFTYCTELQEISLPEGLTNIGGWSFAGCDHLRSLVLPKSLETLGYESFRDCSRLESVEFLGNKITLIDWATFENCSSLLSISIPAGVTSIEARAFSGCESLTSVSIPDTVREIGGGAFAGCSNLLSASLPDGLLEISSELFRSCTSMRSVTIPDSVREIGSWAFEDCPSIRSIHLPKDLVKIGRNAFGSCTSLTSISIPEGVTILEDEVFGRCTSLESVSLPSTLRIVGDGVFTMSGLKSATIVNLTELPADLFSGCEYLESVVLPDNMTSIGSFAFMGCSSLCEIKLPASLREIHYMAFFESGLTSLTIPENVEWIGGGAFGYSTDLTEIIVKPTVPPGMELPGPYSEPYQVYAFIGTSCPIYVPNKSVDLYLSNEAWSAYTDQILPMSERNH
jgi:hypothetical protein